jgi:hypothetical protein
MGKMPMVPEAQSAFRSPHAERFERQVARELQGSILRYSRRQALLKAAEAMSIGRFEANLIIAVVQHRQGSQQTATLIECTSHRRHILPCLLCIATVQAAIVAGAWLVAFSH